jgi:signal transduction histidine kinase
VAVLAYTAYRTRNLRQEVVEVIDPASARLYQVQRILALEMSAQRGYQLGNDPEAQREYEQLKQQQRAVFDELRALVITLRPEPEATEAYAEMRARMERWEADVAERPADAGLPSTRERLSTQNGLYRSVLDSGARLERALQGATASRMARVQSLEHLSVQMMVLLVGLAIGSSIALVRLGRRLAQLADAARARQREMERLAEEKTRFIRGITHDLKNPLGAVDAYAQLLEAGIKGRMTDDQLQAVGRIRRATQEALGTIQDLLELARAEAGHLRIERHTTDPAALIHETVEDYRAALEGAGLILSVSTVGHLPTLQTDPARVREVLGNLLSNALKYTPAGGRVAVEAEVRGEGPLSTTPVLRIRVRDTGPGIAPEERERIFEEFHRAAGSPASGMGLGLAISRRIARLLGGDLTLESQVGAGSTFALWLPVSAVPVASGDGGWPDGA